MDNDSHSNAITRDEVLQNEYFHQIQLKRTELSLLTQHCNCILSKVTGATISMYFMFLVTLTRFMENFLDNCNDILPE